ncbi:MAG: quinone oxidoreductase family protein [Burkholderiales bacterium]
MKAKVIRCAAQGSPEVMRLEEVELSEPAAGEVLIRQTAIGLNFMDVYHRGGQYPLSMPSGLGVEAAGVVEKVGTGVADLRAGDRVGYAGGAPGAYADFRLMPADRMIKLPDFISDEQAVACMMKGMTAEYLLNRCFPVQAGQHVLFMAAAGGVGLVAGQWGKALGARMIGIAGGAEKCRLAAANGYAHVIDRKSEDIVARVKEITGGAGVPVVYDSIGKATFEISLNCLAPRGYFVSFGTTSGAPPAVEAATLQKMGSLYFTRPTLVTYTAKREDLLASAVAVFEMVKKGAIKLHIGQRYRLADVAKAHADLEAGRTRGSSILTP